MIIKEREKFYHGVRIQIQPLSKGIKSRSITVYDETVSNALLKIMNLYNNAKKK